MLRARFAILAVLLFCVLVSGAGAVTMTINASEKEAHVGDVVTLSGTISGIKTIAVYLYVTGPGLNPQGVTLENINAAAGRGLFTTAPVDMATGTWTYNWDTSVILGNLKPGRYTVYATYAMSRPVRQTPNAEIDYATTDIDFLPPEIPANEMPLTAGLPFLAIGIVASLLMAFRRFASS